MDDKSKMIKVEKAKALGLDPEHFLDKDSSEDSEGFEKVASFNGVRQSPYPSPFLNLSDTNIPSTTIEIFQWCKYYYTFDPLINGCINSLSTFPVSEVYLEDIEDKKNAEKSETLKLYERVIFNKLGIHKLLIEIGIDYFLYGNCFIFGEIGTDKTTGEKEWSKVVRLDPSKMIIDHNPATHDVKYKWQIPQTIRRIVTSKDPIDEYNKIPDMIKQAVKENKALLINPKNIYHIKRPTDSMGNNGVWGTPIVANVLKLLMYRNILRQAQEAIAREHIVPMRVFYLDNTSSYNLENDWSNVANNLAKELQKSVLDPNHKVVSPIPINVINVGGEGRALLLTPEIQQIQDEILAGMGVPREFIFGGLSYSGSSISLKILENQFISYRLILLDFLQNFIVKGMARARGEWRDERDNDSLLSVKMTDLKMQDDVQQKQLIIQLNSAGKCTDELMWKILGLDGDKMKSGLEKEALDAIELQTKTKEAELNAQIKLADKEFVLQQKQTQYQLVLQQMQQQAQMQMQMQMQQAQMQQQQEMGGNPEMEQEQNPEAAQEQGEQEQNPEAAQEQGEQEPDINSEVEQRIQMLAEQLVKTPKDEREMVLSKLPPSTKQKVVQKMQDLGGNEQEGIDMRPMPEQKPPRRNSLG